MDVITTHTNADFDAIASIVAASKLYPSAKKVLSGAVEVQVKKFLNDFPLNILKSRNVKLKDITRLIVVDARESKRIGKFSQIKDVPIHIYDHHPKGRDDILAERIIIKEYGATITILLEILRKKGIKITEEEASLFCLGIYEDTGFLTFSTTKREDISSILWLFKNGADFSFIPLYLKYEPSRNEIILLSKLLKSARTYKINNIDVTFAQAVEDKYSGDLAILAHRMMDIEGPSCLFLLIKIGDHIHIIARSRKKEIDVSAILSDFGGGGHKEAASGTIKEKPIPLIKKMLISRIRGGRRNLLFLIETKVSAKLKDLINEISRLADEMRVSCYIVGGFVRDLIVGETSPSLDILIVGDGILFAKKLIERLREAQGSRLKAQNGGKNLFNCIFHNRFKTANILKDGIKIDIVTSRSEIYKHPGALPCVKEAALKKDLMRRDFTINTMAILLNKKGKGGFIDSYQGCNDIYDKKIKVLHQKSFIDDPTRILRAVRFESRLGFKMDKETEKLAREAIKNGYLSHISKIRIRNEFLLILSDERPQKALLRLSKLGALAFICEGIKVDERGFLKAQEALFQVSAIEDEIDISLLHLLVLMDKLTLDAAEKFLHDARFSSKIRKEIAKTKEDKNILLFLKKKSLKNSAIYERLNKMPLEGVIFIMSKTKSQDVKRRAFLFLTSFRKERLCLTGDDLKRLGFKPGPIYKKILKELFHLKLNGRIKTKEDELKFLDKFLK